MNRQSAILLGMVLGAGVLVCLAGIGLGLVLAAVMP